MVRTFHVAEWTFVANLRMAPIAATTMLTTAGPIAVAPFVQAALDAGFVWEFLYPLAWIRKQIRANELGGSASSTAAVDCDMHLFEPVGMWQSYCDPGERDLALLVRGGHPGGVSPLSSIFIWTGVALALTDHIINGVLERRPELRLGVMELSAVWVPLQLQMLDGGYAFAASFNGEKSASLPPARRLLQEAGKGGCFLL